MEKSQKSLEQEKVELMVKLTKEEEEVKKLKANYDVLKEHEFNIIKDCEGKKSKEIQFYEQALQDSNKEAKALQEKNRDLEESIFRLKEEVQRGLFEVERSNAEKQDLFEQNQQLNEKMVKEMNEKDFLIQNLEQQKHTNKQLKEDHYFMETEKQNAFQEIDKLHQLIGEMEKNIEKEKETATQERKLSDSREKQIEQMENDKLALLDQLQAKEEEINRQQDRIEDLQNEVMHF